MSLDNVHHVLLILIAVQLHAVRPRVALELRLRLRPWQYTHTHTHPRLTALVRDTQVSRYQKGKTNLDFTEARDCEWQWLQLGHNASLHLAPGR